MDWLKQSEEMIKMWSDTQQKMLSSWLGSMQGFTGTAGRRGLAQNVRGVGTGR